MLSTLLACATLVPAQGQPTTVPESASEERRLYTLTKPKEMESNQVFVSTYASRFVVHHYKWPWNSAKHDIRTHRPVGTVKVTLDGRAVDTRHGAGAPACSRKPTAS